MEMQIGIQWEEGDDEGELWFVEIDVNIFSPNRL